MTLPDPYYDDGQIRLYLGDCREILPGFEDETVDFIFTDPPYGHNNNNGDLAHRRADPSPTTGRRRTIWFGGSTARPRDC